jgi:molecular chaperone IbpA
MVTYDFSPFYRSTIGFDRMAQFLENAARVSELDNSYPPYNIESVGEDHYRVTVAVAGFSPDELEIEVRENVLYISGAKGEESGDRHFLHHGIAGRAFKRQFRLAEHVKVEDAALDNGLLIVDLVREVPEAMKPRTIPITTGAPKNIVSKAKKLLSGEEKAA